MRGNGDDDADSGEPDGKDPAPRRRGRPPKAQAADLTGVIIEIATRLFLEKGFQATSMDAIAAEAGSSKRTLYARFPSKIHLLEEVIGSHVASDLNDLSSFETRGEHLKLLLPELAQRLYAGGLHPRNIALFRLMAAESFRYPQSAIVDQARVMDPITRSLARVFQNGIDRGEILDRPAYFLAEQFLEVVCGRDVRLAVYGRAETESLADRKRRVEMSVEIFVRGIEP